VSGRSPIEGKSSPPKVAVLASDPLVRSGVERLLEDHGVELVPIADAEVAVAALALGARAPSVSVPLVALTASETRAAELLASGASAVLRRDVSGERLHAAIVAVRAGLVVLDAELAKDALPDLDAEDGEELSARERQVLALIASGLSNRKIAERLGISEHTAKFHASSILAKLGVSTRTEAVVIAARRGLLWL
jgi:two-component system nitrate/nitrite response regulator NarL